MKLNTKITIRNAAWLLRYHLRGIKNLLGLVRQPKTKLSHPWLPTGKRELFGATYNAFIRKSKGDLNTALTTILASCV